MMGSKRDAITQRAMFNKELNDALKHIKSIFSVEDLYVVTDTAGDLALDLALKIGFDYKGRYLLFIIGGGFVKSVAFVDGKEVKRYNFQYEKTSLLDGINKTAEPLFTYIKEDGETKPKKTLGGPGRKSDGAATSTEESRSTIVSDGFKTTPH